MLRVIILVLVLFVSMGTIVPIATDYAEAGAQKQQVRKKKKKKRYRKYRKYRKSKRYRRSKRYRKSRRYRSKRRYRKSRKKTRRYRSKRRYKKTRRYRKSRKKTRRYRSKRRYKKTRRYRKSRKKTRRYRSKRRYSKTRKYRSKRKRRTRKYSKKWWRTYRAKVRRNKAIAKRKRNLRLRRIRLARKKAARKKSRRYSARSNKRRTKRAVLPTGKSAPKGWVKERSDSNEMRFKVANNNGSQIGSGSLTVVASAKNQKSGRKDVAGISTTVLRRTVIDQMIREKGWVVNDFAKVVNGKKVYVVVAKSPGAGGAAKSRIFYFTESKGQIYSLSTVAPKSSSAQIASQSERLIKSLQGSGGSVQSAKKD